MIAYVKHPVTAEQKAKIRAEGFRIIDARFAPKGAEIYGEKAKPKTRAKKAKPDANTDN